MCRYSQPLDRRDAAGRRRTVFPALVDAINTDPKVRFVLHAGDVKNGSSTCDDARFADLASLYGTFADRFVLTPGDNEWTDCHRTAAGGYLPLSDWTRSGATSSQTVQRPLEFGRPVVLAHGDEHVYEVEPGYAGVPNLTRLETFGATATEWLRVTADPRSAGVFSWEPQTLA